MHELSIVMSLVELCEKHAKESEASMIHKVFIKIGTQSGVEPELLRSSFETFKEGTICEKAEFVMEVQDIVVKCRQCGEEYDPKVTDYVCPRCGGTDVEIIAGQEMHLMSLEME